MPTNRVPPQVTALGWPTRVPVLRLHMGRAMVIIAISLLVSVGAGGLIYWHVSPCDTGAAIFAVVASFAASVRCLDDIIATE